MVPIMKRNLSADSSTHGGAMFWERYDASSTPGDGATMVSDTSSDSLLRCDELSSASSTVGRGSGTIVPDAARRAVPRGRLGGGAISGFSVGRASPRTCTAAPGPPFAPPALAGAHLLLPYRSSVGDVQGCLR